MNEQSTTIEAPTTTTSCAIRARDLGTGQTTDVNRDRWLPGKLQPVIDALDGAPVMIVADRMTGHALVGVRLGKIVALPGGGNHYGVHVRMVYTSGEEGETVHSLDKLGDTIVPLDEGHAQGAKWIAKDLERERKSAAIAMVRPEAEAAGMNYGKWEASLGYGREATVTYRPQREGAGKSNYWKVRLGEGVA